jgi:LysR family glycine cleavage system transcriptional activator
MIQYLAALPTFIQVAKHLSFTKAAKELFLSQGAVSVQIKQLEKELGFSLFHRKVRKIFLTREGERLLKDIAPALRTIQSSIESIRSTDETNRLTVSTLPSFAAKWLIPKITEFQQENPKFNLKIHTSDKRVDFIAEQIDCAIRYGLGKYPDLHTTHLTDELYFPVCHPDVRGSSQPLTDPQEIRRFRLLHDGRLLESFNISWQSWAAEMGIDDLDFSGGMEYGQCDYAIQAAIAGQGVALGRVSLVEDDLNAGLLVPLFDHKLKSNFSYYFVHPQEYSDNPGMNLFKSWIIEQMKVIQSWPTKE